MSSQIVLALTLAAATAEASYGYGGYGYGGYGLGYGGYGGYGGYLRGGYWKRSADAEAEADPSLLYGGYGG